MSEIRNDIKDLKKVTENQYPKELLLIINPRAGTMQSVKHLPEIIETFGDEGYRTTVAMTKKSGDGKNYVIQYGDIYDRVVCAGGDGTLNEVIAGVITSGYEIELGYIPAGSTNDFGQSIGLPNDVIEAAKVAVTGMPRTLDIGSFNGRNFSYIASFGAFASTSYSVPQNVKSILGHTAYILRGAVDIFSIRSIKARIVADAGTPNERIEEGKYLFGGVCNATSIGGVLKLDKINMNMNDGMMEVLLIKPPKSIAELNRLVLSLLNSSFESDQIDLFSAQNVKIDIESGIHWTLDGEYEEGADHIEINTLKSAVKFITGRDDDNGNI